MKRREKIELIIFKIISILGIYIGVHDEINLWFLLGSLALYSLTEYRSISNKK